MVPKEVVPEIDPHWEEQEEPGWLGSENDLLYLPEVEEELLDPKELRILGLEGRNMNGPITIETPRIEV
jgi:hypothetical protein